MIRVFVVVVVRALAVFYKIQSGTVRVSLEKDKYLAPAQILRRTQPSHESKYTILDIFLIVIL